MTFSDLERRDATGHNFLADFHDYAQTVWPRATKFVMGQERVSRLSATLPSQGAGSQLPRFCEPLPAPKRFNLERINLVRWHMWGRSVFLGAGKGRDPSVPGFLGPPTCAHPHSMRNSNKILQDDQTIREEIFTRSTTNADARFLQ